VAREAGTSWANLAWRGRRRRRRARPSSCHLPRESKTKPVFANCNALYDELLVEFFYQQSYSECSIVRKLLPHSHHAILP
jgi:hypothetical protein